MHFGAQAYEILSDAEARARYDEIRAMGKERKYTGPQAFKTAFRTAEEVFFLSPPFFLKSHERKYTGPQAFMTDFHTRAHACAHAYAHACTRMCTHMQRRGVLFCFILFYFVLVCFRFAFSFPDTHTHTHIRTQTHAHTHANTRTYARELAGMARPVRRRRPRHHLRYALVVKTSSKD